ncbi:GNAT family N-acetyltransferase [Pseudoteredinibacter isoporae]|uniref:Ribosomal-protein-alanine N-acetyltransferase n=1 Tax=Pseudoteredinibacter isoporae TaxID=570281 RepID=A0A7X0MV70_9GAMM|nr:GNAT family N-acetyltransferase [Pseudoteredinibacter isoporae]MBB6521416.1 ribosomal-protein-alanine N-acetyltransferase [Pseudoteredinibacter isoporae]NHO86971.1 GNAT family N-acetyltransferase [Pseudoteredinibacter isoporae]NIB24576.1 GNAT family N-acetyltransferase [Pseudoteredinibacter isoporae]
MIVKPLAINHLQALLQFELENRAWFESLIEPRGDDFYTLDGVAAHIGEWVEKVHQGRAYSVLLFDEDVVVARGNLKGISDGSAEVGYRVAQQQGSKGLASLCLSHLISEARNTFKLRELQARVLDNNPASFRVLQKQGFEKFECLPESINIQGQDWNCVGLRKFPL